MSSAGEPERSSIVLDAFALAAMAPLASLPGVTRVGLAVSEGGGRRLLFTSDDRRADEDASLEWCAIDATAQVPLTIAARDSRATVGTLDDLEDEFPDFVSGQRESGVAGVAAVPLLADGVALGGFVVYVREPAALEGLRATGGLEELGRVIGGRLARLREEHRRPRDQHVPGGASDDVEVFEMSDSPADVARARRFLRGVLEARGVAEEQVDDAVLCLAELATNAIVHTHGGCRVEVRCTASLLGVRVVDHGGLGTARLPGTSDVPTAGRGLQIVDALASRSGRDAAQHVSWFEIDLPDSVGERSA